MTAVIPSAIIEGLSTDGITMSLTKTGDRYGRLVVQEAAGFDKHGNRRFSCICDCGSSTVVGGYSLRQGNTKSCGCLKKSVLGDATRTHGARNTRAFSVWTSMRQRCGNPKATYFADYGGRGIKVCDQWQEFACFLADMGQPPVGFTIERVDNGKGYEPGNVRWASRKDQANNRRSSRLLEHENKSMTLQQWADKTGIKRATIAYRLDHGWPPEKALRP